MPQSAAANGALVFRFSVFQFHAGTLELSRDGVGIRLQTQPARLLLLMLLSAGELVTRDAIQKSLWPDGTTVDFEVGVNRCIRQLRVALMDDIAKPRYIKNDSSVRLLFRCRSGDASNRGTAEGRPVCDSQSERHKRNQDASLDCRPAVRKPECRSQ